MGTGATDDQVHLGDGLRDGHVVRDGDVGQRDQHVVVACEGGGGLGGKPGGGIDPPRPAHGRFTAFLFSPGRGNRGASIAGVGRKGLTAREPVGVILVGLRRQLRPPFTREQISQEAT